MMDGCWMNISTIINHHQPTSTNISFNHHHHFITFPSPSVGLSDLVAVDVGHRMLASKEEKKWSAILKQDLAKAQAESETQYGSATLH